MIFQKMVLENKAFCNYGLKATVKVDSLGPFRFRRNEKRRMSFDEILFFRLDFDRNGLGISRHFGRILAPNSSSDFFDLWECEIFLFVCLGRFLTKKPAKLMLGFQAIGNSIPCKKLPS